MDILSIRDLTKSFGSRTVIDHLHLSVPAHSVFGFIGKNGAGKTTTMRMIVGLLKPDHGEIQVNGERVSFGENQTNRYIGYLPDVPEYYGFMTASQYLTLCGEITGMQSSDVRRRILDLLDLVGLTDSKKHIHTYSRGMKQRLGIAQALLNAPKLLICDEPTSALDPVGRKEILDILSSVTEETTVLFSTHVLSDVERICDHVALLHDGSIVVQGTLENLKRKGNGEKIQIEFERRSDAEACLKKYPESLQTDALTLILPKRADITMPSVMADLVSRQVPVQKLEKLEPTLEDLFLEVVEHETAPCHDEKGTL